MSLPPYYINELPTVDLEGGLAWMQLASGAGPQLVIPRGTWRHFLEGEIRRLNDHEMLEQAVRKVVSLDAQKPRSKGKR